MEETKIIKTDAKSYENIGKRTHLVDTQETRDLLLDDTLKVIETTLEKDGSTGKLSTPDGIIKTKPFYHRGFYCEIYGVEYYETELDIVPKLLWYGFAKMKKGEDTFEIDVFKKATQHSAGNELIMLVDAYHGGRPN